MKFRLDIICDNAAFDGDDREVEVVRILRTVAAQIENGRRQGMTRDTNGNNVGSFCFEGEEEDDDA